MNDKCADIISKTVRFGGYATVEILAQYLPDTERHIRRQLAGLESGMLLKRLEDTGQGNDYVVYQVTKRACVAYGRGDSHMRKKHLPPFRARALLRSHFLFMLAGQGYDDILTFQPDKLSFFTGRGLPLELLPHKTNNGQVLYQIEETLLTAPPLADEGGVCLAYTDKEGQTAYSQLSKLLLDYLHVLEAAKFPIRLLVICEDDYRAAEYNAAFSRNFPSGKLNFRADSINRSYS